MLTRDLNKLLSEMSLEEKVGQLLLIGFEGRRPNREVAEFIKEGKVGGVVLLSRNAEEAGEAADLICVLQKLATAGSHALPLFIAVDQEGGSVVRLTEGVTVFPSNMALGATGCSDYALLAAEAVGGELASLGVNMNFAPVLDVNNNPRNPVIGIRSFGEDPELVAEFGKMAIKGYQNRGVATVAKHFPGHGDTAFDSHLTMPRVPYTMERLFQLELVPFQAAIACGVDCIMTAHLAFPAIEANPGLPATLSETVLTGLLRQKMGFDGLIITDCLEMQGVTAAVNPEQAAAMAVGAGADLALISHSLERQRAAHREIMESVRRGLIPLARIEEAVGKILRLKQRLFTTEQSISSSGRSRQKVEVSRKLGVASAQNSAEENQSLARRIAADSLTLVRNEGGILPLKLQPNEDLLIITFRGRGLTLVEEGGGFVSGLFHSLRKRHLRIEERIVAISPEENEIDQIIRELKERRPGMVILATQDAGLYPGQATVVKRVAAAGFPSVVIALRTPYDLAAFPEVKTFIAAYGFRTTTLEALAGLLWGEFLPLGKLPVSIPGLYPAGYGLEGFD